MPFYEFVCQKCGKKFQGLMTLKQYEQVKCPSCKSKEVRQQVSSFFAVSARKS